MHLPKNAQININELVFVCLNRRFAASGAMTIEEQEQRTLYANVLEYEQDHVSVGSKYKQGTETCGLYI